MNQPDVEPAGVPIIERPNSPVTPERATPNPESPDTIEHVLQEVRMSHRLVSHFQTDLKCYSAGVHATSCRQIRRKTS